jgi:hypothetical protein
MHSKIHGVQLHKVNMCHFKRESRTWVFTLWGGGLDSKYYPTKENDPSNHYGQFKVTKILQLYWNGLCYELREKFKQKCVFNP